MAVAISGIIATIAGTGAIGAALQTGLALFTIGASTTLGSIALSFGLSYLASSLFRPKQPKPEDVQTSMRQATAPRVRHYGRVKTSGPWVFAEAKSGNFYKVLALGQGPIDAVEQFWIDDIQVDLDANGNPVAPSKFREGTTGTPLLQIRARAGVATETAYGELTAQFPEWTAAHRGDGVASLMAIQSAVEDQYFLKLFPNGINTNYRVVMRAAKVKNPVTGIVAWSDDAAAVVRDYMTHSDGMRLPESMFTTPMAQAGWVAAYNHCAEAIPLKSGGSEPRYRLWGSYSLDERPADVLGRMLSCCDGRLVPTPDGGLTLDVSAWVEPSVIIDADAIVGFSDLGRGRDIMTTANTVRATYLDQSQDYQAADADPWVDASDVSLRGEVGKDIQLNMSPSHSQARRIMKKEWFRANPNWIGTFTCNLRGLAAFGEKLIRIRYPLFGIDSVFEVQDFRFILGEGGLVQGVSIQAQSMPPASDSWNPAQEEGDAPVSDKSTVDDALPVPAKPTVAFGTSPLVADLTFTPSPSPILNYMVRWKKTADATWTTVGPLEKIATSFTTPTLDAATSYDFQLAMRTEKGRLGDWSATKTAVTP